MNSKFWKRSVCVVAFCCVALWGQTVSSTLVGTVIDSANAVIANAKVTLTDQNTGSVRVSPTDASGIFRFLDLGPSTYSVSIQVAGFKTLTEKDIVVEAQETRNVGNLALQIGNLSDSITVIADATPVQLASSEKSYGIDANQLDKVTLKGRDLFGYMSMVPGVVDTTTSRDVTTPQRHRRHPHQRQQLEQNQLHRGRRNGPGHRLQQYGALRAEPRRHSGAEGAG